MRLLLSAALCFITAALAAQENYVLEIGNKTFPVNLDSNYLVTLSGQQVKLRLKQKDTLSFVDPLFGFSYLKGVQYAKTTIDENIEQYTVLTAEGSGYLVQKYKSINPESVTGLMLQEVTKESINYGYKEQRETYTRKLASGQPITVTRSTLTYKEEKAVYEVGAIGGKDEGVLVVTIDPSGGKANHARALIQLMWQSLVFTN